MPVPVTATGTTLADLVADTRRHLESVHASPRNQLETAITATAKTLTFKHESSQVQPGSHLEIGLELLYVWSVDQGTRTATVQRGLGGSTPAAHSAEDVVMINPRFSDFAIVKALNEELSDLSSPANGLFAVKQVELSFSAGRSGYDFGTRDVLEVLEVRHRVGAASSYRQWPVLTHYELARDVSTTDFPSGVALFLHESGAAGQPISVLYKGAFTRLVNLTDDVGSVAGMPLHLQDIPPMGAAMRLVAPREIRRNQTEAQGDSRRADEVPPGAVVASVRGIAAMRQSRINAEVARLSQQFPDRGFIPVSSGLTRWGARW